MPHSHLEGSTDPHRLRFPFTISAVALSVIVLGFQLIWHINLVTMPLAFLERIEQSEIDDVFTLILIAGVCFLVDNRRNGKRTRAAITAEQSRAVLVTVGAVDEIVDGFIAQLRMMRDEVHKYGKMESTMFDELIRETQAKLRALREEA